MRLLTVRTSFLLALALLPLLVPARTLAQGTSLVGASVDIEHARDFCFELSGKPSMRIAAITLLVDLSASGKVELNGRILDRFSMGGLKRWDIQPREGKHVLRITPDGSLTITRLNIEAPGMSVQETECPEAKTEAPAPPKRVDTAQPPSIPSDGGPPRTIEQRLQSIEGRLEALERLLTGKQPATASQSKPSWEQKIVRVEKFALEQAGLIQDLIKEFKAIREAAKK